MKFDLKNLVRLTDESNNWWVDAKTLNIISFAKKIPIILKKSGSAYVLYPPGQRISFTDNQLRTLVKKSGIIAKKSESKKPEVKSAPKTTKVTAMIPMAQAGYFINAKSKKVWSEKRKQYLTAALDGAVTLSVNGKPMRVTKKQINTRIYNYNYQQKKTK